MGNSAASCFVTKKFSEEVVRDASKKTLKKIGGQVSCAFVFVSADWKPYLEDTLELIQLHGHVPVIVGCCASGIIGTSRASETGTGFSMLFLHLPKTTISTFRFDNEDLERAHGCPEYWYKISGIGKNEVDAWFALAGPTCVDIDSWLLQWNQAYPGIPCMGGLASNSTGEEEYFIFENRSLHMGAVALAMKNGIHVYPIVSQGCRPIGQPFTITRAEKNMVYALGARPAYEILIDAFETLSTREKSEAPDNLFVGMAMSEYLHDFHRGDFLVRNILGACADSGAVAINSIPRTGQTLQYQIRDKTAAEEDLRVLLAAAYRRRIRPFASLIFSCTGRGELLYGITNYDPKGVTRAFGPLPCSGFFCNGEIGPVQNINYSHRFTASIALFCDS